MLSVFLFAALTNQIIISNPPDPVRMAKFKYEIHKVRLEWSEGDQGVPRPIRKHICSGVANIPVYGWGGVIIPQNYEVQSNKNARILCDTTLKNSDGTEEFALIELSGNMGIFMSPVEADAEKTYFARLQLKRLDNETGTWKRPESRLSVNKVDDLRLRKFTSLMNDSIFVFRHNEDLVTTTVEFIDDAE